MPRTRWTITILSFALMLGASVWVVASHWPPGGLPALGVAAHAAAFGASIMDIVFRGVKIQASAHAVGLQLRFMTAVKTGLAGDLAAAITPARSGAEPARFLVLAEAGMPLAGRVLVLFMELFLEMCSLVLLCLTIAFLFRGRGTSVAGLLGLVAAYSVTVLSVGAIGLLVARRNANGPPPAWARGVGLHAGRWRAVQRVLRELRHSVRSLRGANPWLMLVALSGSFVHLVFRVAALPLLVFLGDRTFAVTMESLAPLVLWPLALFYGGVVVPAPGGGGFIEGAFAATLKGSIPSGIFAASLIWWRFYTFYLYIIAGGLAAGDSAMRAIRRRDLVPSELSAADGSSVDSEILEDSVTTTSIKNSK